MSTVLKWFVRILGGLVVLVIGLVVAAGLVPSPTDPPVDMANHGAGASSVIPSTSGLLREFPPINVPDDNPVSPDKVELGRLLFFDPILSENNDIACATCHHPDLGFSDGRPTSVGPAGVDLKRNVPSLWNVGYARYLFWDGRTESLEEQVEGPLTHADEMGVNDPGTVTAELQTIPEYVDNFDGAFADGLTFDNLKRALAAFQRTLVTNNSPFDRYAAGDFDALTASQRRGLALFRSGATRCFECHAAPTFASDSFRVIGVDSQDPGRAGVSDEGTFGAFKVPSLRNIALSAPYMHDGSMATLRDVVDFYANGGGLAHGAENVDIFVNGFELTDQEREDLIAFLYGLSDESQMPDIPERVPSGLPVIQRRQNPERAVAATVNQGTSMGRDVADREPMTIVVQEGESIQAAVDRALPGDTVEVPYGVYHERVVIDISDLTLRGIPDASGALPILDGESILSEGIIASGNDFTLGNFHTRNYTDNGVLVEGVTNVHFHDIFAENVGTYGVYPVRSSNVIIERVEVTGVDDAGIYAGQSENVVVRDSIAYGNVIGIELENTVGGEVVNNHTYDNSVGILIVLLPQLTSKVSIDTEVRDNIVEANNHPNFAPPGAIARTIPPGVGILLLATDNANVHNNTIQDNNTSGVAVFSLTGSGAFDVNEIDVGPLPEGNWVHDNTFGKNGSDPDEFIKQLGIPAGDILWDGSGSNNRFNEPGASGFPPLLPGDGWPALLRRGYGNVLNFVIGLVT